MANAFVRNCYNVYLNGEIVFTGTAREVAEKYGCGTTTIYEYSKPERCLMFKGKYEIVKVGTVPAPAHKKRQKKTPPPKKESEENPYEYMFVRLVNDGSTICMPHDLEKATKYLESKGIRFTKREVSKNKYITSKLTNPHKSHREKGFFYVLEKI